MLINIGICDDEQQQLEYLKKLVLEWGAHTHNKIVVHTFENAEQFVFAWEENKSFDLLLLDIELGGQNGVDLAKTIRKKDEGVCIIFVTGLPDYIEEGYEVSALHYLMKPINENKLCAVLDKAIARLNKVEPSIVLVCRGETIKVLQKDIFFIEAFAHSTVIHTVSATYELKKSISKIESELEAMAFIRCHRSYLVGIRHISRISKTDILLDNGQIVPLSRRMYNQVNKAFIHYFKGGES